MGFEQQLIFLFSALGGINGILLSGYFFLRKKSEGISAVLLGGLLLMLSIRTIKSVFHHFNSHLFEAFVQFGLGACFLIGPLLFLYVKSVIKDEYKWKWTEWLHIIPYALIALFFSIKYSYYEDRRVWSYFIDIIYKQWFIYIFLSAFIMRKVWMKIYAREKLKDYEVWLLYVFIGTLIVYIAFETVSYTSYIVGALSFTFLLFISILLLVFNRRNRSRINTSDEKYAKSNLDQETINTYTGKLDDLIALEKPYLDSSLTLQKLSKKLNLTSKDLSQIINQSTGKNYSQFIAKLRIEEAKRMLKSGDFNHYKISAIAYESGFNSLSSFNHHFKKIVGIQAVEYKKQL